MDVSWLHDTVPSKIESNLNCRCQLTCDDWGIPNTKLKYCQCTSAALLCCKNTQLFNCIWQIITHEWWIWIVLFIPRCYQTSFWSGGWFCAFEILVALATKTDLGAVFTQGVWGKLWGVFCGNFGENWQLCNDTALYSLQTGASITASDSLHSHLVIPNTILIALKYLMFVAHYWIPNHSHTHLPNAFYIQWMALSSKKTDVSLLFFVTVLKSFHSPLIIIWALFQYKDCLSKYGDFHDKDKISSLSWWPKTGRKASLYWDAPGIHLLHTW